MGFAFIDIIFLAIFVVFLLMKLRNELGTRNGSERKRPSIIQKLEDEISQAEKEQDLTKTLDVMRDKAKHVNGQEGLATIQQHDPGFRPSEFIYGAKQAFEYIVENFAAGNKGGLESLLSPQLMDSFETAIDQRVKAEQTATTEILNIKAADIKDVKIKDKSAYIVVSFTADETRFIKDKEGEVISGNPNLVTETKDIWTFKRALSSQDPNWTLVETKTDDT